jgi:hypothetical protein
METRRLPTWLFAAAGLAGFLLVLGGEKLYPLLQPATVLNLEPDPACDLRQGSCSSSLLNGAQVSFGIEPRDLPVMKPLTLSVTVQGQQTHKVEASFNGVDMNMGINHADLQAIGEGSFSGTITIPVCIRNGMEWEAKVLVHTPEGIIAVPYRFWTGK